jgi:hypothetical protein
MHCGSGVGFATVVDAAQATVGSASKGATAYATAREGKLLNFKAVLLLIPIAQDKGIICIELRNLMFSCGGGSRMDQRGRSGARKTTSFPPFLNAY